MLRRTAVSLVLFALFIPLYAQVTTPRDAAEIKLALKKLTILGSVLYIAAHPDDENTALLAAMAKGRCYRTAYLSCTRGEGGQNLIGPEQGDMLGLIRTQELLAARRIDGAEQYFTRAIDFGYSKTSEETLRMWGHERTLADVVWVIRHFRPDVIITRFTPTLGGHGNHTASAQLAEEAFRAASDPARFPEQLPYVSPWKAKRIVWNVFRFSASDTLRQAPPPLSIDLGAFSPLLGRSFTEIAGEGRSMHKSQGFGAAQNRGEFLNYFVHIAGDSAARDLFEGVTTTWSRVAGSDAVAQSLEKINRTFDLEDPSRSVPGLFEALRRLSALSEDPWVIQKRQELTEVILACAGLWVEATTPESSTTPGSDVKLDVMVVNRSRAPLALERITLPFGGTDTLIRSSLQPNRPIRLSFLLTIPTQTPLTQPYWLLRAPLAESYEVSDPLLVGKPQSAPAVNIRVACSSPDGSLDLTVPLRQRFIDPVDGETSRPFQIVPPVAVNLEESVFVYPDMTDRRVVTVLKAAAQNVTGLLRLNLPHGWFAAPTSQSFNLKKRGDEDIFTFVVTPSDGAISGRFTATAEIESSMVDRGAVTASYKHIPPQTLFPAAEGKLLRIDLKRKGQRVGYVMGAGDEMPNAIRQLGYTVTLLSDRDLAEADLRAYDVIVAGIRAYNTRPALRLHQNRMMEYVHRGGTYVVQYVTPQRSESENLGPYPFNVSRDRVTEEDAPVSFVHTDHPLVNTPNRITPQDFAGWVQERGLSFADRWDAKYDSVLVCHDANESARSGGLLAARYGSGYYVYCAYAFFRQLPAGVEGAYRLFANILSLQREKK